MKKERVVIGLSGGVDSSVAAHLLLEQGYEVIALFMKNWHDDSVTISDECPWLEDSYDAMMVAEKLGIPFQTVDLSEEYRARIVDYMFAEYEAGRTPNPDVLCNREIKFDVFLKMALSLGADYVATGHYCRRAVVETENGPMYRLISGKDGNKDQSYFLCQVNQEQLSKALFPIGDLTKPQVREIAKELELVTAEKKDSQGLCFVGKVRLPDFLQQQLKPKKGRIIEIPRDHASYEELVPAGAEYAPSLKDVTRATHYLPEHGKVVGEHNGAHFYTIGQRKGLAVGGTPEPLFVIETDTKENVVYTGQGEHHPGLYRKGLFISKEDTHWIRTDMSLSQGQSKKYQTRIRYRQGLEDATLFQEPEGLYIVFDRPQRGVAKGQFATWYEATPSGEMELIGSGVID